ncbi:hypothetical protein, partial [Porphyromonas somerae]|uniref:hypothetical protein n=1 Tax=Porphyromonas somerae TaxID=322095 RepID=UPI002A910ADF
LLQRKKSNSKAIFRTENDENQQKSQSKTPKLECATVSINRKKQLLSFRLNINRSHLIREQLPTAKMTTIINHHNTPVLGELRSRKGGEQAPLLLITFV